MADTGAVLVAASPSWPSIDAGDSAVVIKCASSRRTSGEGERDEPVAVGSAAGPPARLLRCRLLGLGLRDDIAGWTAGLDELMGRTALSRSSAERFRTLSARASEPPTTGGATA